MKKFRSKVAVWCARIIASLILFCIGFAVIAMLSMATMVCFIKFAPEKVEASINHFLVATIGHHGQSYKNIDIKYDPHAFALNAAIAQMNFESESIHYSADDVKVHLHLSSILTLMPKFDIQIKNHNIVIQNHNSSGGISYKKLYDFLFGIIKIHIDSGPLTVSYNNHNHVFEKADFNIGGNFLSTMVKANVYDTASAERPFVSIKSSVGKYIIIGMDNMPQDIMAHLLPLEKEKYHISFSSISGIVKYYTSGSTNFDLTIMKPKFHLSQWVAAPISFDSLNVKGASLGSKAAIDFESEILTGHLDVDTEAQTARISANTANVPVSAIEKYWHPSLLNDVRMWLVDSIKKGTARKIDLNLNIPCNKAEDMNLVIQVEGAELKYATYFPKLTSVNGTVIVDGTGKVFIRADKALSSNTEITNTSVEIYNNMLHLKGVVSGSMYALGSILVPSGSLAIGQKFIDGYGDVHLNLSLPIHNNITYTDVAYNGTLYLRSISSPFLFNDANSNITFKKNSSSNVTETQGNVEHGLLKFYSKQQREKSPSISKLKANINLDVDHMKMKIDGISLTGYDMQSSGQLNIDMNKGIIADASLSEAAFQRNNFKLEYTYGKNLYIKGESLNIRSFHEIFKDAEGNHTPIDDIMIDINKMYFLGGVSSDTFKYINRKVNGKKEIQITSDIISAKYREPNPIKREQTPIFVLIPNIETLVLATSNTSSAKIENNGIDIKCFYKDESYPASNLECTANIQAFKYKGDVITFRPNNTKIPFIKQGDYLIFPAFKIHDDNHLLNISGKFNTQTNTMDFTVYYTPSKLEVINSIPIFKEALAVATIGATKKGIVTLRYDITGTPKHPVVKLNKTNLVKNTSSYVAAYILIPLLLAIL